LIRQCFPLESRFVRPNAFSDGWAAPLYNASSNGQQTHFRATL